MGKRWKGILGMRNTWTGDGRMIEVLSNRDLPLTLRVQRQDNGGHSNAIPCGTIDAVWFEGDEFWGSGEFSDNEDGQYAQGVVADQSLRGVSMDPGLVTAIDVILAGDGTVIDPDEWWSYEAGEEPWDGPFSWGTIYSEYQMAAATLVATPAFAEASIAIDETATEADGERSVASSGSGIVEHSMVAGARRFAAKATKRTQGHAVQMPEARRRLVASTAYRPPVEAFRQREFKGYERFTIDPETGFMYGHVYPWEGRHRGFRNTYVRPPQSRDFSQFLSGGSVTCDDGTVVDIGLITHFKAHLRTLEEYELAKEDPANQLGPVAIYADDFGVQVAGIVWPDVDPVAVARAAAAYPSGDWSTFNGEQKLTGIALVNNPGFHAYDQEGVETRRLVASFESGEMTKPLSARALADLADLDRWASSTLQT